MMSQRPREVISTARYLSVRLAEQTRVLRDCIETALATETERETEHGPLTKLMKAFQEALVHDLDAAGFADMYAQTVAYGLFSARIANPGGDTVCDSPALGGLDIDFEEPGVREVAELLDDADLEAVVRDFGDRNPQEDPVLHFYEHFLKVYDKKQRMQRGVFYTPRPVVSFIVRSVDRLLCSELGLEDGFADTTTWGEMAEGHSSLKIPAGTDPGQAFVQILDPATGTGTFLVEVIDLIHKTMTRKWQSEGGGGRRIEALWNDYVPKHLLPRLYGYELMMAPYAIAHLKIRLKLGETGYRFGRGERVRIYLTNALEPAQDFSGAQEAVHAIKRDQRFTVVIGNPPYSVSSENKSDFIETLMEDYKKLVRGAANIQPLSDDYLKFLRLYEALIVQSGYGTVGVVTNNVFLDGLMHKGVRARMVEVYSEIRIVNLHGNTTIGEQTPHGTKDENVFDIKQGVCISLFSRKVAAGPCRVISADLYGERASKNQRLGVAGWDVDWASLAPVAPHWFLVEKDFSRENEYNLFVPLGDLMPTYSTGVATHRDSLLVDPDPHGLKRRIEAFCSLSEGEAAEILGLSDTRDWKLSAAKKSVTGFDPEALRRYSYKPFSRHFIYYDPRLIDSGCSRIGLMRSMFSSNVALVIRKKVTAPEWRHAFVTRDVTDFNFYGYISVIFPLKLSGGEGSRFSGESMPNLSAKAAEWFPEWPETFLAYSYSILYSPTYRARYTEFLKIDFPRIPNPKHQEVTDALAGIGQELIALHLLESPRLDHHITTLVGSGDFQVEKVSCSDETVWIDNLKTRGFRGVSEEVWNFHIGGYQVCKKWLKDRQAKGGKNPRPGRVLTDEEIDHYQRIVVALSETIRMMGEIDEVIEQGGGWPGAFNK